MEQLERTLVLFKSDAIEHGVVGKIFNSAMGSPGEVEQKQLDELSLEIKKQKI